VTTALVAIGSGGWLVVADTRRQLGLAQKKADFVSTVSHELKTPLTSIRMFTELMQGGKVGPERVGQYLRIILLETERLTRLINNVLDFARQEKGPKPLDKRRIDLGELLARVWETQEPLLREAGFEAGFQREPEPVWVEGDADMISQIVINLLSNAEKYSGEKKELELQLCSVGAMAEVRVLDRGSGVPSGQEKKIFEAFYRAHDSLSSGVQGSGLGLTLARGHAREHGGDIVYEHRQGGGSCFTLSIPLER
jgi:signal transduction histidine kinase